MAIGIDLLFKGGILVWPIILCSLVGATVFLQRLFCLRAARDREGMSAQILGLLEQGDFEDAERLLRSRLHHGIKPLSSSESLLLEAISMQGRDRHTLEMVLVHGVERQIDGLCRYIPLLTTCGNIAPLLGLLGTVFGMIKAFMAVETMGGRVNATVLAGGIWEAMLTTAFGLLVAIPLILCQSYLETGINQVQAELEEIAITVLKVWTKENGCAEISQEATDSD